MNTFVGRVYKIINNDNNKYYIGSTKKKLKYRLSCHKNMKFTCKFPNRNEPLYVLMDNVGRNNFFIVLINEQIYTDRKDLYVIENKYINMYRETDINNNCLNLISPINTSEENKQKKHKYYLRNREKQYRKSREKIMENKESHDKYKKYMKDYYKDNKQSIILKRKVATKCECGRRYTSGNKSRHYKLWH